MRRGELRKQNGPGLQEADEGRFDRFAGCQSAPDMAAYVWPELIAICTSLMARVTSMPRGQTSTAVEGGAAAPYAHRVGHDVEALFGDLVTAVEDEAVRLDDRRRLDIFVVGPERGAGQ